MYKWFLAVVVIVGLVWKFGPRRGKESGFKYVYVNQDGSVRELSPDEQNYLSKEFSGGDSGRPSVKFSYEGSGVVWGSQSGFLERRRVPRRLTIRTINPNYDQMKKGLEIDILGSHRAAGDLIETQEDGSVLCTPNPNISQKKRLKLIRKYEMAEQQRREAMAKFELDN